ncbi:MAG: Nif3-like dinuclear metal center hexameric protein [Gemmatimonadetes bacterium]|nr:Nif3-like dinuclear metal center hexameric protein [Gemmatimonadota bacterium]
MTGIALDRVVQHLDETLRTRDIPDSPGALNGLQVEGSRPVARVAAAVDASRGVITGAIGAGADLLIVHHGLFWGGTQRITGPLYRRLAPCLAHGLAIYSAHLPLDCHPTLGNNVLLAGALGLEPSEGFGRYETIMVGVAGQSDVATDELVSRAGRFAAERGGRVVVAGAVPGKRTRRWALVTGAGASSQVLREAAALGVDTLVVGEGPHHTAVEGPELGLTVIYAGHYATETLGVCALGAHVEEVFGIPWSFISAPTGL